MTGRNPRRVARQRRRQVAARRLGMAPTRSRTRVRDWHSSNLRERPNATLRRLPYGSGGRLSETGPVAALRPRTAPRGLRRQKGRGCACLDQMMAPMQNAATSNFVPTRPRWAGRQNRHGLADCGTGLGPNQLLARAGPLPLRRVYLAATSEPDCRAVLDQLSGHKRIVPALTDIAAHCHPALIQKNPYGTPDIMRSQDLKM